MSISSIDLDYIDPRPEERKEEDRQERKVEEEKKRRREEEYEREKVKAESMGMEIPELPVVVESIKPNWDESPIEVCPLVARTLKTWDTLSKQCSLDSAQC